MHLSPFSLLGLLELSKATAKEKKKKKREKIAFFFCLFVYHQLEKNVDLCVPSDILVFRLTAFPRLHTLFKLW